MNSHNIDEHHLDFLLSYPALSLAHTVRMLGDEECPVQGLADDARRGIVHQAAAAAARLLFHAPVPSDPIEAGRRKMLVLILGDIGLDLLDYYDPSRFPAITATDTSNWGRFLAATVLDIWLVLSDPSDVLLSSEAAKVRELIQSVRDAQESRRSEYVAGARNAQEEVCRNAEVDGFMHMIQAAENYLNGAPSFEVAAELRNAERAWGEEGWPLIAGLLFVSRCFEGKEREE